jgi:hypothetical protein
LKSGFLFGWLFWSVLCATVGWGQRVKCDWRTAPANAYAADKIQVRFSPAFFDRVGTLPDEGNASFKIPVLDSIFKRYGVTRYQKLVTTPEGPAKVVRNPQQQPVLRWVRFTVGHPKLLKPMLEVLEQQKYWIEIAEPVYHIELHHIDEPMFADEWLPNDTLFKEQWHYHNLGQTGGTVDADIDLPEAWSIEKGHPSVVVAIMDNGIDTTHPDLRPNLWARRGFNFVNNQNTLVPSNHGNHVAGTIGAVSNNITHVAGIAGGDGSAGSGIRLMSCQIFGSSGNGGGVENALVYSADNGAAISHNSWGFSQPGVFNQSTLDAIDYFIENGGGGVMDKGLVIFSGGNRNEYTQFWPAVYHRVIGVTGTTHRDTKAWYSTFHEKLDIAAPGGETNTSSGGAIVDGGRMGILSTITVANGSVGYLQGTSMAAPQVTGVAALIISKARGRISADDVKSYLLLYTDPIEPLLPPQVKGRMGTGRLNAFNSLERTAAFVANPEVPAPANFAFTPLCDGVRLQWQNVNPDFEVLLAVSTDFNKGGLFGIPTGNLAAGQLMPGGGRILYKGKAESFDFKQVFPDSVYFFKIWTVDQQNNYSYGVVLSQGYTQSSALSDFTATANCYSQVNLNWSAQSGCPLPDVLIAVSSNFNFAEPTGQEQVGSNLGTDATIIFKGNGSSFEFTPAVFPDGQTLSFRIWPYLSVGRLGTPITQTVTFPAAITSFASSNSTTSSIELNWAKTACFDGEYILAASSNPTFGQPTANLVPGDTIAGGGRVIYKGSLQQFVHSGLDINSLYYYAVWPVLGQQTGQPRFTSGSTVCAGEAQKLPFKDPITPESLDRCKFDTLGIRNFTAGPLPRLSVVTHGVNPDVKPFGGNYMLAFNSFDTRETNEVLLTSPRISTEGTLSVDVRYKWWEDDTDYNSEFFLEELIALSWSTDKVNWQPVDVHTRIPQHGTTGWKYKQATLPAAAANQPNIYLQWTFRSGWGFNCYLDEIEVEATKHQAPEVDAKPVEAKAQFLTPLGITHFYDSVGHLMLSVAGNEDKSLGHIEDDLVVTTQPAAGARLIAPANASYPGNPGGWVVLNQFYHIRGFAAGNRQYRVRHYLSPDAFTSLQQVGATALNPPLSAIDSSKVMAYIMPGVDLAQANPAGGHNGVPRAIRFAQTGFWQLDKGTQTDTLQYRVVAQPGLWNAFETLLTQPGGGGVGVGSTIGNGALQPNFISIIGERVGRQTRLRWSTGYERRWTVMDIERRAPGSAVFEHIGTISANGLPQSGNNYSFTDNNEFLTNGVYYYRIKGIDLLGRQYLSAEVGVEVVNVKGVLVYPNPVTTGTLDFYTEVVPESWHLYDATGRLVRMQPSPTGTFQRVPVGALPSGVYFLHVVLGGENITKKVLLKP